MVTLVSSKCHEFQFRNQSMCVKPVAKEVSFLGSNDRGMTYAEVVKELNKEPALLVHRRSYHPPLPSVFMHDNKASINYISISEENLPEVRQLDGAIKDRFSNILDFNSKKIMLKTTPERDGVKKTQKVGVILSGGPAPGGHNVITGIYDALKGANPNNEVYGFLDGPDGIVKNNHMKLNDENVEQIRNTGGFSFIGTGRTKLEKEAQFEKVLENCKDLGITAVVIIGGDDSNTNAAVLAEWFKKNDADIQVIGCPKTIDGDLKNSAIETSFGFDSATKFYSEAVSNLQRDNLSSRKQWHFCQLMGRSASNVTLEVALQTHPNITLISEEIKENNIGLNELVDDIVNTIATRAENGKNYGTVLIPEGLIEFIPETSALIDNLNDVSKKLDKDEHYNKEMCEAKINYMYENIYDKYKPYFALVKHELLKALTDANGDENAITAELDRLDNEHSEFAGRLGATLEGVENYVEYLETDEEYQTSMKKESMRYISRKLSPANRKTFKNLNMGVKLALLGEKDPHGNIKVSQIKTNDFIVELVQAKLHKMGLKGEYTANFAPISHEYGYDGRCGFPTSFDTNYCYALGYTAAELIESGATGYMATVQGLDKPTKYWKPAGIPIPAMMNMEERNGKDKPVIKKALVELDGNPYKYFESKRNEWAMSDAYRICGPSQFLGPKRLTQEIPITLKLEKAN